MDNKIKQFSFSSDRAMLSLLEKIDFEEVLEMFHEPDTFQYISPLANLTDEAYLAFFAKKKADIKAQKGYYWVCRLVNTGELLGCINLTPIPSKPERIQIGWQLKNKFHRQGFATELASRVLEFAQQNLEFSQIFGVSESENIASIKILKKLGFQLFEENTEGETTLKIFRFEVVS
mgnify:CR=1 FL=1